MDLPHARIPGRKVYSDPTSSTKEQAIAAAIAAGKPLANADLSGADLRGHNWRYCDLAGAKLDGCTIDWQSHALLAEILRQAAAKDVGHLKFAGLVAMSLTWCWPTFLTLCKDDPDLAWALDVFRKWVRPGDGAPEVIGGTAK